MLDKAEQGVEVMTDRVLTVELTVQSAIAKIDQVKETVQDAGEEILEEVTATRSEVKENGQMSLGISRDVNALRTQVTLVRNERWRLRDA